MQVNVESLGCDICHSSAGTFL